MLYGNKKVAENYLRDLSIVYAIGMNVSTVAFMCFALTAWFQVKTTCLHLQ